ncbi:MAG: dihydropteroate synthase [Deltaproteobacteria bacterium]|jgi:5-methyltetrahydrofolate corrinoid/iron sulfur protein methyltransferase|nr:dihydropteroate synthase [Deltaproteobacteria bacterium]
MADLFPIVTIAENLNVTNKIIGAAFKDKDEKPIRKMLEGILACNPTWVDINLGPARKNGAELMPWVVNIVQSMTDLPVVLDTTNIDAIEAGLKTVKRPAMINSIMCRPERYEVLLPMCKQYGAYWVGLMWGPNGMARDANERAELTTELLMHALGLGIDAEFAFIDPIITPVNIQQDQLMNNLEFIEMLPDIVEAIQPGHRSKSTNGVSNVSNGNPEHLRPILNKTYLCMLIKKGMYSSIVDSFDPSTPCMFDLCQGRANWFAQLVWDTMDGKYDGAPDYSKMKKEEADVVKTAKVVLGHSLFSASWLDI